MLLGDDRYVLEVKGGLSDQIGLQRGDRLVYKDKGEAVQIETH